MTLDPNFNMLAPLAVTETELVSGIPDAENQVYVSANDYDAGDLVWGSGHVWRALKIVNRNKLRWSESFDNAVWFKTLSSVTANQGNDSDGNLTADLLSDDSAASPSLITQTVAGASEASTVYTGSIEVKQQTATVITFNCYTASEPENDVKFDFSTGTITSATGTHLVSSNAEDLGAGWYRLTLSWESQAGGSDLLFRFWPNDRSVTATEDDVLIAKAQLQKGATYTAYQKTESSVAVPTLAEGAWWTDLGAVDQGASAYDAGTTYNTGDYAVYQGQLWLCASNSTTGITPVSTASEWTLQGATNRLKAFDGFLQDVASLSGGMTYVLEFTDRVTAMAVLRANGTSVNVTITDDTEGEVYNQTVSILDVSAVTNWYEYFFYQPVQQDTVLVENLPPYTGAEIAVTITGDDVSVGQIIAGTPRRLGTVKVGTSVGIESYSIKDRDDFNRALVVPRPYSDTVSFDLAMNTLQVGYVKRQLALREAQPTLYFMSEGAAFGAVAYGFFRDFDILHSTAVLADCVLEVEGLG